MSEENRKNNEKVNALFNEHSSFNCKDIQGFADKRLELEDEQSEFGLNNPTDYLAKTNNLSDR